LGGGHGVGPERAVAAGRRYRDREHGPRDRGRSGSAVVDGRCADADRHPTPTVTPTPTPTPTPKPTPTISPAKVVTHTVYIANVKAGHCYNDPKKGSSFVAS
jgi:hypothetical protein